LSSINKKEIRRFGAIVFLFFGALFVLTVWRQKIVVKYLFGFLSLFGFGLLLALVYLRPLYIGWIKVGHFIGRFASAIFFALVYYLIITPIAFVKRIVSGRPLPMYPDRNLSTYWIKRMEPVQPKERFIKKY